MILYLKTTTEEDMIDILSLYGFRHENAWVSSDKGTLDVIGKIYRPTGETQEIDGMTILVTEEIPGFHANLLWSDDVEIPSDISNICIQAPTTPERTFFV